MDSGSGDTGEGALEDAGWDVEHIGDGVFEPTEDEEHDREEDSDDFTFGAGGAK